MWSQHWGEFLHSLVYKNAHDFTYFTVLWTGKQTNRLFTIYLIFICQKGKAKIILLQKGEDLEEHGSTVPKQFWSQEKSSLGIKQILSAKILITSSQIFCQNIILLWIVVVQLTMTANVFPETCYFTSTFLRHWKHFSKRKTFSNIFKYKFIKVIAVTMWVNYLSSIFLFYCVHRISRSYMYCIAFFGIVVSFRGPV